MRKILKMTLVMGIMLAMASAVYAQATKTAEELKAEREQLKTELKSKDAEKRRKKLENLKDPGVVDVESVDKLAASSTLLLTGTKGINASVPELYKRTVGETIDGVTEVNVQKPTLEELTAVATSIATTVAGVATAQDAVQKAADDVKSMPKTSALKAAKSLNYSKDALSLVIPELQLNAKVMANLIETLKTSGNY
jgi:type II secretory pathway pseudopilin PulG